MSTTTAPLGTLTFLYQGSADFERDLAYYGQIIGAQKVWHFEHFGARVAAFRVGEGPLMIIADHRPAPSCLPVFAVEDLEGTVRDLKARGCEAEGGRFEIPNGPCYLFKDPSGNAFAIFQDVCPKAMEQAYADSENTHAIRD
jgi:predicted enzyme related to lactoylglutathione lyase